MAITGFSCPICPMQPSLPPVQHVALAMASLRKCRLKEAPPPDCTLQMPWTGSLPSAAALSQGERRSLPLATQLHSGSVRWALSPSKRQCFSQSFFSILSPSSCSSFPNSAGPFLPISLFLPEEGQYSRSTLNPQITAFWYHTHSATTAR